MITDKDNTKEFLAAIKNATSRKIHVGVLAKESSEMQTIVAANEFGATIKSEKAIKKFWAMMGDAGIKPSKNKGSKGDGVIHIPERAFIRKAFDNAKNVSDSFKSGQKIWDMTGDIMKAINAIGSEMVGKVQESSLSNIQPANHPLTTAMKNGKEKTLVNKGRLQQAISYEVV